MWIQPSVHRPLRLVLTGATGLLGANFALTALKGGWQVTAITHKRSLAHPHIESFSCELHDTDSIVAKLNSTRADWLVHFAAATNVDECESDPITTARINTEASGLLAEAASRAGTRFLYMSTDSVFDGERGGYGESDKPSPLNVYAKSKLLGEIAAVGANADSLVVRGNIFGWAASENTGLAEWILRRLNGGLSVPGFDDCFFAPLLVTTLSEIMLQLMSKDAKGVVHVASRDYCSKYEFAQAIAKRFQFAPDAIVPTKMSSVSFNARRPRQTWLRCERLTREFSIPQPSLSEDLDAFRAQADSGYIPLLRNLVCNQ